MRRFPGYGKLSGKSIDQLRAGERVAVLDGKEDPLDFVMWKSAKESEPDDAKWPSDYGLGRPGWHIECSAMCKALLGEHFDIHGGGQDLQFPHHENEIAQSEGASGRPFVNVWMHNGLLNTDNEKMSKSLGNFFTIRDVLKRFDGETIRFFMVRAHYRSQFNFSDAGLDDARSALRRLYTALDAVPIEGAAEVDWNDAARRGLSRGDERRLQHADRRVDPVRARRRGEPRTQGRRRDVAEGPGRHARRAAAGAARLPAIGRGPLGGRHRRAHRGARRGQARARLRALPMRSATSSRRSASSSRTAPKAPPG